MSAVVEGDLDLGRVFGLQAKISPVTSTGRWRGRHLVQFTNWGNAPVRLKLTPTDPDEKLGFVVHPEIVEVPIGATTARPCWCVPASRSFGAKPCGCLSP